MRLSRRTLPVLIALLCTLAGPLFAAEAPSGQPSQYSLGDQTLSINAGLFVPLFLLPMGTGTTTVLLAPSSPAPNSPPHLSLGAVGSLNWAAYLGPQIRLGIDVAGDFSVGPNGKYLLMLPFIVKGSWVFTVYPFEIPVSLGVGMNIVKYDPKATIDLLIRPGISGMWIFNASWSFGLNLNWWFDMQFAQNPADSRIGNFLEVTLSALYHF